MPFMMEARERDPHAPPPSTEKARRIELPDEAHYVMARGGQTQTEGAYLVYLNEQLERANQARAIVRAADKPDTAAIMAANGAVDAAVRELNAGFATYLADRVTEHNFTDGDGKPLPLGLDLFWALPGLDAVRLAWVIQSGPSFFALPKAENASSGG